MGGFLSAIGGAGNAAAHYGEQVRGLLESRRKDLADFIGKAAEEESDPQTRASLLLHSADLHAGKPIGKITTNFLTTLQKRQKDHEALTQAIGAPPGAPPPPAPSTAPPGQVPGSVGASSATPEAPAAQPATNPIQGSLVPGMIGVRPEMLTPPPQAAAQPLTPPPAPTAPGPPPIQDYATSVLNQTTNDPRWAAPANRPVLQAAMTAQIQHELALRQEQALRQMDLTERQTALKQLESSPEWSSLPPLMRSQYRAWAHSRTAPLPAMAAGMMRPQTSRVDAQTMSPEDKAAHGIPPDATGPYWTYTDIMTGQPARTAQPAAVGTVQSVDQQGGVSRVENRPGANQGTLPGIVSASNRIRGVGNNTEGNPLFASPNDLLTGRAPLVSPGITPGVTSLNRNPEQRFIAEYQQKHPSASVADALTAYKQILPPQRSIMFLPQDEGGYRATEVRSGSSVPGGALTAGGVNTMNVPTASTRTMAEMAKTVLEITPQILAQVDALKQKLGPAAGRWNQLWVNKAGFDDPDFAGLDQDLDLYASAIVRTHFGGRGSSEYREALRKNFSQAQSPEDLKARIQHAETWIEGYAKAAGNKGVGKIPPVKSSGGGSAVDDLLKKHGF